MKRFSLSFVLVVVALLAHVANGQVRFDLGIKGGPNFAKINTSASAAQNYSNRTGYHFGAYAMLKLTKIAIQPEVIFSRQGQQYAFPGYSNLKSSFDYINIPIIIKLYIAAGLNIQAGPQFGFLSSSSGYVYNTLTSSATSQSLTNFVKSSDVSLAVGAGWDLPLGLNVTARYNVGLSDINKYTGGTVPSGVTSSLGTQEAKNQVFQFSVGYRLFKFGK